MRAIALVLLLVSLHVDARPRTLRRPAADPVVHYRGDAERSGVYVTRGPRTFAGVIWQVSIGQPSFSAPIYANGTLYYADGNGRLVALNAETGATRWRTQSLGAFLSIPAIATDAIYLGSESKRVYALNPATGATLWTFTPDDFVVASPLVKGGRMYFGTEGGTFYAIDLASHAEVWRFSAGTPIHASAALTEGTIVFDAGAQLIALDVSTGTERWRRSTSPLWLGAVAVDGVVYAISGDGLIALDARTGEPRWSVASSSQATGPTVLNGVVYTTTITNQLVAYDALNGRQLWTRELVDVGWDPFIADAAIYVGTGALQPSTNEVTRRVYALEAATGAELWSTTVEGHVRSGVALGDGKLFLVTSKGLVYAMH